MDYSIRIVLEPLRFLWPTFTVQTPRIRCADSPEQLAVSNITYIFVNLVHACSCTSCHSILSWDMVFSEQFFSQCYEKLDHTLCLQTVADLALSGLMGISR